MSISGAGVLGSLRLKLYLFSLGSIVFLVIMILSLLIFIASFDVIKINEYGLLYNTWIMKLYDEPRSPGRFWLGLGKKFIRFPRNLLDFQFKNDGGNVLSNN